MLRAGPITRKGENHGHQNHHRHPRLRRARLVRAYGGRKRRRQRGNVAPPNGAAFFRLSAKGSGANLIVTLDQEID